MCSGTLVELADESPDLPLVVEGGLNDYTDPATAGRALAGLLQRRHVLLVVGPAAAPARGPRVVEVDAQLSSAASAAKVPYLSLLGVRLTYQPDGLHPTDRGHELIAHAVAAALRHSR